MRNTMRSFRAFSFYDRSGIEAFLEKQSEKGWLLDEVGSLCWRFRRVEPGKRHYAVSYFPYASAFDPEPSEAMLRFLEFCAHDGWQLAATNAQMQIFYNEAQDPTPIETDAAIEVDNIHRSVKKSFLWTWCITQLMGLLQVGLFVWRLVAEPIAVLGSDINLFAGISWLAALLLSLTDCLGYWHWYFRAKRAAADGEFVQTRGTPRKTMAVLLVMFAAFVLLLLTNKRSRVVLVSLTAAAVIIIVTVLIIGVSNAMKRRKVSSTRNLVVTFALTLLLALNAGRILVLMVMQEREVTPAGSYVYDDLHYSYYRDELPLYVEDMMDVDDSEAYSHELSEENSLFMSSFEATQRPLWYALDQPRLWYRVYTVKFAPVFEPVLRQTLAEFAESYGRPEQESPDWEQHLTVDAEPWGADAAYQLSLGGEEKPRFILCYGMRIVEIDFDWEPDAAAKALVGQTLGG